MADSEHTPSLPVSRRSLIAGAAAVPALAVPVLAAQPDADAAFIAAFEARQRDLHSDEPEPDDTPEEVAAEWARFDFIADTPVSTPVGALLKLAFAVDQLGDNAGIDDPTHTLPRALGSLKVSASKMSPTLAIALTDAAENIERWAIEWNSASDKAYKLQRWSKISGIFQKTGVEEWREGNRRRSAAAPRDAAGFSETDRRALAALRVIPEIEQRRYLDTLMLYILAGDICYALESMAKEDVNVRSYFQRIEEMFSTAGQRAAELDQQEMA